MGSRQTPRLHRDEKEGGRSPLVPELTHMVFKEYAMLFLPLALTRSKSYGRLWALPFKVSALNVCGGLSHVIRRRGSQYQPSRTIRVGPVWIPRSQCRVVVL